MNKQQLLYYNKMLECNRLIPIKIDNKLVALITYFIGNNDKKYMHGDSWIVLDDEPSTGTKCYIDQCISYGVNGNTFKIWYEFKRYIKNRYPQVNNIKWARYKGGTVNVFNTNLN